MGALKITIQQFYRPGGDSTQNRGVVADVELPSLTTQLDVGESDLDYALKFGQVDPLPHDKFHMVDSQIVDGLRSARRTASTHSDYFAKVNREIDHYKEQKDKEDGHAQQGEVPQGAGRARHRQGARKAF